MPSPLVRGAVTFTALLLLLISFDCVLFSAVFLSFRFFFLCVGFILTRDAISPSLGCLPLALPLFFPQRLLPPPPLANRVSSWLRLLVPSTLLLHLGFSVVFAVAYSLYVGLRIGCASLLSLGLSGGSSSGFSAIVRIRLPLTRRLASILPAACPSAPCLSFLPSFYPFGVFH